MKKLFLSICSVIMLATAATAQKNTYAVSVSFRSICCGVPDDAPLMKFIQAFKREHKIKSIKADHIGPMGKEGEYELAFRLKEMSKAQKVKFIRLLKKIVPTMTDKGSASVNENVVIDKATLWSRATITTKKL